MIINKIIIKRLNESLCKIEDFKPNFNYIFNPKNNMGKSTFMRIVLYALGFAVPSTKKVSFADFEIDLEINVNNKILVLKRQDKKFWINDNEFFLPRDTKVAHLTIFDTDNHLLINNILGVMYIDQDRGWTLLNRGHVIGGIKFSIEEFLQAMEKKDIDIETKIRLQDVNKDLEKYRKLKVVADYREFVIATQGDLNFQRGDVSFETHTEELKNELNDLNLQKSRVIKRIKNLENSIFDNIKFVEWLEKFNIYVKKNEISIPVKRETIENYDDIFQLNKIEIHREQISLQKLNEKITQINVELNKQHSLFKYETIIEKFDKNILDISINKVEVDKVIKQLSKKQSEIKMNIIENIKKKNKWTEKLYTLISNYAKELKVEEFVKSIEDIFTHDLKSISGAVYHKLVFIFRLSYIRLLSDNLNYKLPIFIDSPNGREIEQKSVEEMIKILERDFEGHQVFLATIFEKFIIITEANRVIYLNGKFFDKSSQGTLNFDEPILLRQVKLDE